MNSGRLAHWQNDALTREGTLVRPHDARTHARTTLFGLTAASARGNARHEVA
jgi:hypothetical protein